MAQQAPRYGLSLPNAACCSGDEQRRAARGLRAGRGLRRVRFRLVGDSLFAKPRLESLVLLAAIAARTRRVRLGTCCLSTFSLRDPIFLAAQWPRSTTSRMAE